MGLSVFGRTCGGDGEQQMKRCSTLSLYGLKNRRENDISHHIFDSEA